MNYDFLFQSGNMGQYDTFRQRTQVQFRPKMCTLTQNNIPTNKQGSGVAEVKIGKIMFADGSRILMTDIVIVTCLYRVFIKYCVFFKDFRIF